MKTRVLIAGISTRAIAESAARAAFDVTAIDAFGDLDQHSSVQARSLGDRFSPDAAVNEARSIACDAVAYGSNFENHSDLVGELARGRTLWGNPGDVIRRVRDPLILSEALRRRGFAVPDCRLSTDDSRLPTLDSRRRWLAKPLASGGGHHVRAWSPGTHLPAGCYLQELVDGTSGSVALVAAGRRAVPIGLSRQLIGDKAFGASGYRYSGNILVPAGDDGAVTASARALVSAIAEEFDLVGVNGVDFVAREGVPYAVEVNPRWSASMELVERAYGLSVFAAHAAACRDGVLPDFDLTAAWRGPRVVGKAVVFARRHVTVGDTRAWLEHGDVRDVPHPNTRILAGRPVCTVFAAGRDADECYAGLVGRAERIYSELVAML